MRLMAPLAALAFVACTSSDSPTALGTLAPPTQPGVITYEAGANCASSQECNPGLVCLVPAGACNALPVCVVAPPTPCDHPQNACSCLGEVIQVCDGYATSPVDSTAACEGGTAIAPMDSGSDVSAPPPVDAGPDAAADASPPLDASGVDAADARGD